MLSKLHYSKIALGMVLLPVKHFNLELGTVHYFWFFISWRCCIASNFELSEIYFFLPSMYFVEFALLQIVCFSQLWISWHLCTSFNYILSLIVVASSYVIYNDVLLPICVASNCVLLPILDILTILYYFQFQISWQLCTASNL